MSEHSSGAGWIPLKGLLKPRTIKYHQLANAYFVYATSGMRFYRDMRLFLENKEEIVFGHLNNREQICEPVSASV